MRVHKIAKKYFIPHKENNYKPHIFREISISIMVLIAVFLFGLAIGTKYLLRSTVLGANISTSVLVDMTNETRLATNEPPLIRSEKLDSAAQLKAEDMIKSGYFAHVSPTGEKAWNFIYRVGYVFKYAGENLAINFSDANDVHQAWLNSPTHKANLVDIKFREIGMSAIEGMYNGVPTIYIVQMFATPAKEKVIENKQSEVISLENVDQSKITLDKNIPSSEIAIKTTTDTVANTAEVKGASTSDAEVVNVTKLNSIRTIVNNPSLQVVEDTDVDAAATNTAPIKYSKWYERAIYDSENNINKAYAAMFVFVALSLIVSLIVELHRQHYKHIFYGIGVLFLIIILSILSRYINI